MGRYALFQLVLSTLKIHDVLPTYLIVKLEKYYYFDKYFVSDERNTRIRVTDFRFIHNKTVQVFWFLDGYLCTLCICIRAMDNSESLAILTFFFFVFIKSAYVRISMSKQSTI